MIRMVTRTPRSARIIIASSSSQSIGLTAKVSSNVSKNFIGNVEVFAAANTCLLSTVVGTTTAATLPKSEGQACLVRLFFQFSCVSWVNVFAVVQITPTKHIKGQERNGTRACPSAYSVSLCTTA